MSADSEKFIPTKEAASLVGRTSDYVARLAREKKISAKRVGRSWLVNREALLNHFDIKEATKEVAKEKLSQERKEEYELVQKPTFVIREKLFVLAGRLPVEGFVSFALAVMVAFGGFSLAQATGVGRLPAVIVGAVHEKALAVNREVASFMRTPKTVVPIKTKENYVVEDSVRATEFGNIFADSLRSLNNFSQAYGYTGVVDEYAVSYKPKRPGKLTPRDVWNGYQSIGEGIVAASHVATDAYVTLVRSLGSGTFKNAVAARDITRGLSESVLNGYNDAVVAYVAGVQKAPQVYTEGVYAFVDTSNSIVAVVGRAPYEIGSRILNSSQVIPEANVKIGKGIAGSAPKLGEAIMGGYEDLVYGFVGASYRLTDTYKDSVEQTGDHIGGAYAAARFELPEEIKTQTASAFNALMNHIDVSVETAGKYVAHKYIVPVVKGTTSRTKKAQEGVEKVSKGALVRVSETKNLVEENAEDAQANVVDGVQNFFARLFGRGEDPVLLVNPGPAQTNVVIKEDEPVYIPPRNVTQNFFATTDVNKNYVDSSITSLHAALAAEIQKLTSINANQITQNIQTLHVVNRIEDLSDTILRTPEILGGTLDDVRIRGSSTFNGDSVTANTFTGGTANFATTTLANLTVTNNITAGGTLSVAGLTSQGVLTGPYFTATSTTATSTFAGSLAIDTDGFVYATSTRNVGIGVLSPSALLSLKNATNTQPIATFANDSGTELFRFTNTGRLGIGTSSPYEALSVDGNGVFTGSLTAGATTLSGALTGTTAEFTSATTTNATSTNLFATNATLTNTIGTNATITNATTTSFYSAALRALTSTLTNLIATNATLTNATTTNATSTNLAISSLTSGRVPFVTTGGRLTDDADLTFDGTTLTGTDFIFTRGTTTNATSTNLSVSGTFNAVTGGAQAAGITVNADGYVGINNTAPAFPLDVTVSASKPAIFRATTEPRIRVVAGGSNVGLLNGYVGDSFRVYSSSGLPLHIGYNETTQLQFSSGQVDASVSVIPTANATYDLGSPSFYWDDAYLDSLTVNNLSAASTSIAGTNNASFSINSDNATSDGEDSSLVFYRGVVVPNAVITWDASEDHFDFNQNIFVQNDNGGIATSTLTVRAASSQTGNLFTVQSNSGAELANFGVNGYLGLGSTTPNVRLTIGTGTPSSLSAANYYNSGYVSGDLEVDGTIYGTVSGAVTPAGFTEGSVVFAGSGGTLTQDNDNFFWNDTTNRLGIGTTTPTQKLSVWGDVEIGDASGNNSLYAYNADRSSYGQLDLYDGANGNVTLTTTFGSGDIIFTPGATGGVGIGTSTPQGKLHVVNTSSAAVPNGNANDFVLQHTGNVGMSLISGNSSAGNIYFTDIDGTGSFRGAVRYDHAIDALELWQGGGERLTIIGGDIGIGTTTPDTRLTVAASGANGLNLDTDTSNSTLSSRLFLSNATAGQAISLYNAAGALTFNTGATAGSSSGTERVRISSSGYVGIGTTSPDYPLDVDGDFRVGEEGGSLRALFVDATNGRVGIGHTSNPSFELDVVGSARIGQDENLTPDATGLVGQLLFDGNGYNAVVALDTAGLYFGHNSGSRKLFLQTDETNRLTIDASGNVGIGEDSPSNVFHITNTNPTIRLEDSDGASTIYSQLQGNAQGDLVFKADPGAASGNTEIIFEVDGSEAVRIESNGNVGIGTTSPYANLSVTGPASGDSFVVSDSSGNTDFVVQADGTVAFGIANPNATYYQFAAPDNTTAVVFSDLSGNYRHTFGTDSNADPFWRSFNGTDLNLGIDSTNVLTIASTTNQYHVGISTSTPWGKFSVVNTYATPSFVVADQAGDTTPFLIDASGNVGIGTSTPAGKLHIVNGFSGTIPYSFADELIIETNSATGINILGADANSQAIVFGSASDATGAIVTWNHDSDLFTLGSRNTGGEVAILYGNNVEGVRIDSSGNVGVGTTAPETKLQVSGGNILLENTYGLQIEDSTGANRTLVSFNGSDMQTFGTTNNNATFQGFDVGFNAARSAGGATDEAFLFTATNDLGASDEVFQIADGGGNLFTIMGDGQIGIGAADPLATLHVEDGGFVIKDSDFANSTARPSVSGGTTVGDYEIRGFGGTNSGDHGFLRLRAGGGTNANSASYIDLAGYSTDSDVNDTIVFGTAGTERVRIEETGNVGIGTTSPTGLLTVNGSVNNAFESLSSAVYASEAYHTGLFKSGITNGASDVRIIDADNSATRAALQIQGNGGSTEVAFFGSNGDIGINTASPGNRLSIALPDEDDGISFTRSGWGTSSGIFLDDDDFGENGLVIMGPSSRDVSVGVAGNDTTDGFNVYTDPDNIGGADTFAFGVFNNGNVGIGSTSPKALLSVDEEDAVTALIVAGGASGADIVKFERNVGATAQFIYDGNNADSRIQLTADSGSDHFNLGVDASTNSFVINSGDNNFGTNDRFVINSSGNVGIGTTTPVAKLTVLDTSAGAEKFVLFGENSSGNAGTGAGIRLAPSAFSSGATVRAFDIVAVNDGANTIDLDFRGSSGGSPTSRVRITGAGNVGIGTTTPSQKLSVGGGASNTYLQVSNTGTASSAGLFQNSSTGYGESDGLYVGYSDKPYIWNYENTDITFATNNTVRAVIDNSGNVGIGTTTPYALLSVSDNLTNGTFNILQSFSGETVSASVAGTALATRYGNNSTDFGGFGVYGNGTEAGAAIWTGSSVSGEPAIFVDATGNVGIGTSTPEGTVYPSGYDITNANTNTLVIQSGNTTGDTGIFLRRSDDATGLDIWQNSGNGDTYIESLWSTGDIFFRTQTTGSAVDAFTIGYNGNIGIGTTAPSSLLHLDGNDPTITLEDTAGSPTGTWTIRNTDDTFRVRDATTGADRLTIDASGNVGIGDTTPNNPLEINTANKLGATFTGTANGEGLRVTQTDYSSGNYVSLVEGAYDDSNAQANVRIGAMYDGGGSNLAFGTSNAYGAGITNQALWIDSSGWVGVGTTTEKAPFSVGSGSISFGDSYRSTAHIQNDNYESALTLRGGSTGYFHAVLNLVATSGINARALGTHAYDETGTRGWFWGRPYTTSDAFAINRRSTAGFSTDIADTNDADVDNLFYINSSGNVGINTNNPSSAKLVVNNDSDGSNGFIFTVGGNSRLIIASASSGSHAQVYSGNSVDLRLGVNSSPDDLVIKNGGNIGLSTTTPDVKLSIAHSGATADVFKISDNTGRPTFVVDSSGVTSVREYGLVKKSALFNIFGSALIESFNPNLTFYDQSAGGDDSWQLEVNGGALTFYSDVNNDDTYDDTLFVLQSNSYAKVGTSALADGNIFRLEDANGLCQLNPGSGSLATSCSSDERLKSDIVDAQEGGLSYISDFRIRDYTVNADGSKLTGVIAQEVLAVRPDMVTLGDNGFYLVEQPNIWKLVQALQELDIRTAGISTDALGNVGIGTSTPQYKLHVLGDAAATSFVNISTREEKKGIEYLDDARKEDILEKLQAVQIAEYRYEYEDENNPLRLGLIAEEAPSEVLSVSGKGVDIYKLATFTLASVQELATRVESLEERVAALEAQGIIPGSGGVFSTSTLQSALSELGVLIEKGFAQFDKLAFRQLIAEKDNDGQGAAGTGIVRQGDKLVLIENKQLKASSKIFVTFTSPVVGSWFITDKANGSFRVNLDVVQPGDVSFDYFIVQTERDVTPTSDTGVVDTEAPVIEVLGANPYYIATGVAFVDPGVTITDNVDQNLQYELFVDGYPEAERPLDTSVAGEHVLTYKVLDTAGNLTTATRGVVVGADASLTSVDTGTTTPPVLEDETASTTPPVVEEEVVEEISADTVAPEITLNGAAAIELTVGDVFTDLGASATDDVDGDISGNIVVTGEVDTVTAGLYTLTYTVADAAGNESSVSRIVTVKAPVEEEVQAPEESVVE